MSVPAVKRGLDDEVGSDDPNKKARPDTSHLQEIRILIENPEASVIIGKQGANVKMVRETSSAFVSILKTDNPGAKERVLTLKGPPECNAKAGELIARLLITANNERKQVHNLTSFKSLISQVTRNKFALHNRLSQHKLSHINNNHTTA